MIDTYVAGRRLKIHPGWREPFIRGTGGADDTLAELVPEAHGWLRVDNYVHSGYLKEVKVSEDEFLAAVLRYAPDQAELLCEKAGLDPDVALQGPHRTPRRRTRARAVVTPLKDKPEGSAEAEE